MRYLGRAAELLCRGPEDVHVHEEHLELGVLLHGSVAVDFAGLEEHHVPVVGKLLLAAITPAGRGKTTCTDRVTLVEEVPVSKRVAHRKNFDAGDGGGAHE